MSGSLAMWQSGPAVRPALLELRPECVTVRMNVEKHFLHIPVNGPVVWRIAVSADFGLVLQDISAMPISVTVPEMKERIALPYWYLQNLQVEASVCVLFCVPRIFVCIFLFPLLVVLRPVSCSHFDRAKLLLRKPSLLILIGFLDNLAQSCKPRMRGENRSKTRNLRYSG